MRYLILILFSTNIYAASGSIDLGATIGGSSSLIFADSIVNTAGTVTLVNDSASPGNTKYYGTDGTGVLGFFSIPASGVTNVSATAPIVSSGGATPNITCNVASGSQPGCLASADFTTFNNKQAAGNYITALTGDISASGPGSAAATLATVNSNVGSFGTATQVSSITVNGKGLITAAANTSIQIAESQVTNLVSDLAGKQPTGNYITDLTGDATASGPGSVAITLASVGTAGTYALVTTNSKGLVTSGSASPYTMSTITSNTNAVCGTTYWCNTSGGAFTVTLPAPVSGCYVGIIDANGTFDTNNLTLAPNSTDKIQYINANFVINAYSFSRQFLTNGTDWLMQ